MRISKIHVPESTTKSKNLEQIDLTKKSLGSTVALVGKNGAGKSRILSFIENYIQTINPENLLNGHIENIPADIIGRFQQNLTAAQNSMKQFNSNKISEQQKNQFKAQAIQQIQPIFKNFQRLGKAYVKQVDNDDLKNIKAIANNNNNLTFEQILNNQHFLNLTQNNPQNRQNQATAINEFTQFNSQSTIQYFTKLTNEIATDEFNLYLKNRKTPELVNAEIKKKKSFQLFTIFQDYVKKFLGKDFSYQQTVQGNTVNSTLHYNDEPFNITYSLRVKKHFLPMLYYFSI